MVVHVPLQFNYYHIIYDITFIDKNLAELGYVHNYCTYTCVISTWFSCIRIKPEIEVFLKKMSRSMSCE